MKNRRFAVALMYNEVLVRSRDVANVCRLTHGSRPEFGSDDDPRVYIIFESESDRDGAYRAFRDMSMQAQRAYILKGDKC